MQGPEITAAARHCRLPISRCRLAGGLNVLKGRYGFGWMIVAWLTLAVLAMTIAFVLGPQVGRLFAP